MQFNRWKLAVGGGLCMAAMVGMGVESVRSVRAADDQEDAIRKALDNLKNGAPPMKEAEKDKPADLNPVDAARQAQDALNAARKKLAENPNDEQAKKDVEELQKKVAEAQQRGRFAPNLPNFPMLPIQPLNPADLDRDIAEMMKMQRQMFEQQMRLLQGNRGLMFNGNRIAGLGRMRPNDLRLGIRIEQPNPTLIDQLNLPDNQGIVVVEVYPGTPADKAGLKPNDILLEIGGKPVASELGGLQQMLQDVKADEKVDLTVLRKGKKETLKQVEMPVKQPEAAAPNLQVFPLIPNARVEGIPADGFGNARVSSVAITVNNGEISIKANEDGVKYNITGVKDDGGFQPTMIEIDDHGTVSKTDKLDKVDEQHKPMVEKLLKRVR